MAGLVETMAKAMFDLMIQRINEQGLLGLGVESPTWEGESEQLRQDWRETARRGLEAAKDPLVGEMSKISPHEVGLPDYELAEIIDRELAA